MNNREVVKDYQRFKKQVAKIVNPRHLDGVRACLEIQSPKPFERKTKLWAKKFKF